ncbi:MAG: NnrU family protein [Stellaceae bacterium]
MVRVTRHPFLTGVGLWALVHLIGNGDVASLFFFATLGNCSPRWHRVDRCKAPTAPGCRLGAICRADLHCSIRRHRGRAEPVQPS